MIIAINFPEGFLRKRKSKGTIKSIEKPRVVLPERVRHSPGEGPPGAM
jgi:hypothetical protein